jgi:hypothetical protein
VSKLLISTSCRYTNAKEPSGYIHVYDINENRIIRSCNIIEHPYRLTDPNPRGGYRGSKGISICNNMIAVSNASTIFLYDNKWNPVTYFWNPICSGIHDIKLYKDHIWITSARNDLLICLDFRGNIIDYYDARELLNRNPTLEYLINPFLSSKQILRGIYDFRDPQSHDNAFTDKLHVNSFVHLKTGDLLISCGLYRKNNQEFLHYLNNKFRQSFRIDFLTKPYLKFKKFVNQSNFVFSKYSRNSKNENSSFLIRVSRNGNVSLSLNIANCSVPSHSVYILKDNSAIYLNTTEGEIIHFDPVNDHIFSKTSVGRYFLRGVIQLPDHTLILGDNNELIYFDLDSMKVLKRAVISKNKFEGIFDIEIMPSNFLIPPQSFIDLHNQRLPVNQL